MTSSALIRKIAELTAAGENAHFAMKDLMAAYADFYKNLGFQPESSAAYIAARAANLRLVAAMDSICSAGESQGGSDA